MDIEVNELLSAIGELEDASSFGADAAFVTAPTIQTALMCISIVIEQLQRSKSNGNGN